MTDDRIGDLESEVGRWKKELRRGLKKKQGMGSLLQSCGTDQIFIASKPAGLLFKAEGRSSSEALFKLRESEFNHGRNC